MRIQYISDLHLEFGKPRIFGPSENTKDSENIEDSSNCVLCLAGDIGYPFTPVYEKFLINVSRYWKKIFLICGNHEFYSPSGSNLNQKSSISEIKIKIGSILSEHNLTNISFLDNSYEDYEDYRFVGTSLWSKLDEKDVINNSLFINDFYKIHDLDITRKEKDKRDHLKKVEDKVKLYNSYHQECVEFLTSSPIQHSELPVVMITHHLPSYSLIDPKYMKSNESKGSKGPIGLNQYFASHLDHLIKSPIKVWVCGHTHTRFEKRINDITVYCNPGGYPDENEGLDMNKFIHL